LGFLQQIGYYVTRPIPHPHEGAERIFMSRLLEPALSIAVVILAIVAQQSTHLDIRYIVTAGIIVFVVYVLHQIIQHKRGSMIDFRFPWLLKVGTRSTRHTMVYIEGRAAKGTNIYLITPDMYNDARKPEVQALVERNLTKGIVYHYINKDDTEPSETHILEVMHRFAAYDKQLKIYEANDLFLLFPIYNVLVIEQDEYGKLRVFIELPVLTNGERVWWVEADPILSRQWHRKILGLLRGKPCLVNEFVGKLSQDENC
jgi:hypothetical protein